MGKLKTLILLLFLVWQSMTVVSQEEEKTNPILFTEVFVGGAGGEASGFLLGAEINYQQKKNLFSLRYTGTLAMGFSYASLGLAVLPFPVQKSKQEEVAALYGRRLIREGHSLSFSVGPAYNRYTFYGNEDQEQTNAVGVAFETNILWFKKEKRRYRIYGIIPVGNPTALGHSYGFKLSGNISQTWYTGVSFIFGWGWHKTY